MRPRNPARAILQSRPLPPHPRRYVNTLAKLFPELPLDPHRRKASTIAPNQDWVPWIKSAAALKAGSGNYIGGGGKALLFAGLGSYPHTPHSPTDSSLLVWEEAIEALLNPDATINYWPKGMDEFADQVRGSRSIRGWMRGWVQGRTLNELMKRPDVTAAFILTSSIAILASAKEHAASPTLLPEGTTHLAGHGFIGTLTALVAANRLDLSTGVRLAMIYASLPPSPSKSQVYPPQKHQTTVLSARHSHSLSSPSFAAPYDEPESESSNAPGERRRAMQLILDEIHGLEKEWEGGADGDWAGAGIINSSKVLVVTGTQMAVGQVIERLQQFGLANPVMDIDMPCPYHTKLMNHAVPKFRETLMKCHFRNPDPAIQGFSEPIVLDPMTTHPIDRGATSLLPHLTNQLRWHKTLSRLYLDPVPPVNSFLTVGKGAKGLGVMLKGELKKREEGSPMIRVEEFGVGNAESRPKRVFVGA